jgi:hypothetical protein
MTEDPEAPDTMHAANNYHSRSNGFRVRGSAAAFTTIIVPFLVAIAVCGFASIWPLRLDARALQDLNKVQSLGLPKSSGTFAFFSRDNSIESARLATFGLRQLAFPDGAVFWAVLKERCNGPWSAGFSGIDASGNAFVIAGGSDGEWQWSSATQQSPELQSRIANSFVVYDTEQTRASFEQRWPFLKACERTVVLTDAPSAGSVRSRRFANEFRINRIFRIASLVGSLIAVFFLLTLLEWPNSANGWLISGVAVFVTLGLNISFSYLLQTVSAGITHWTPTILWLGLLGVWLIKASRGSQTQELFFPIPQMRAMRLALVYLAGAYVLLFLVRLDFDGDFFNNWLPQARFHYLLGRHDPLTIIGQGSMQAASYPPGYGIVLSTLMWMTGMNPTESFLVGTDTSFAILVYRLFIFGLNAALLVLILSYLGELRPGNPSVWVACIAVTLLLIPTTAGKHIASETVLFPMLAASILMIAAGNSFRSSSIIAIGIAVGGMATLIKWEATIIFGLAVLPWAVSALFSSGNGVNRSAKFSWVVSLALSLVPVLVWKLSLKIHNEFFLPVTWSRFVSSLPMLPGLAGRAARGLLDDGRLLLLALALPCAVVLRYANSKLNALPVPLGIAGLVVGFVVIFLFSNLDPNTYLDTSYSRLTMIPTFGAIVYCAEALATRWTPSIASTTRELEAVSVER